jgi:hypothetical protein
MARQPSLAAEIKQKVLALLKQQYPETFKQFKLKCQSYSTGGAVDIIWIDGPSWEKVRQILAPLAGQTIIHLNAERRYTEHFLQHIATRYSQAKGEEAPAIQVSDEGYASIAISVDNATSRAIHGCAIGLDVADLDDLAFKLESDGSIQRTSLILKQDYSEGDFAEYALIGRQGYAKMSGPNVWFDIFTVVKRLGPHRVKVIPGTGRGYRFDEPAEGRAAIRQLATTGKIEILCDERGWHF